MGPYISDKNVKGKRMRMNILICSTSAKVRGVPAQLDEEDPGAAARE